MSPLEEDRTQVEQVEAVMQMQSVDKPLTAAQHQLVSCPVEGCFSDSVTDTGHDYSKMLSAAHCVGFFFLNPL